MSVAAVSKVINGKAQSISAETKAKIFAIIEHENYVPYKKVIDRANRNANMVALIVGDLSDIFSSELAVIGFDDTIFCELLEPNLTSIRQSAYEIGQRSAEVFGDIAVLQATAWADDQFKA